MRPSGPLPPRVYWVRRLLGLALVVILVLAIWWLVFPKGSDGSPAAQADLTGNARSSSGTPDPTPDSPSATSAGGSRSPSGTHTSSAQGSHRSGAAHQRGAHGPRGKPPGRTLNPDLESPTANCDPSQVRMSIDVADSVEGRHNTATFVFRLPRAIAACTLAITPDTMVVRVTSGPDVVWSSGDCPDTLLAKEVVVRTDPATVYQFSWNGRRSTDECPAPGAVAAPGGYWVEAALIGGEPQKAYFDVTESPSAKR